VPGFFNRHSLLWLDKGRKGAHWHTRRKLDEAMRELPVAHVRFSSAIFLSSGANFAQTVERALPKSLPWGAFLFVSVDVAN